MKKAAKTIRNHWDGVVAYLRTRVTNGAAEAINGIIQTVKRKARGFPNESFLLRLVSALLAEISEDWETGKIYLSIVSSYPPTT